MSYRHGLLALWALLALASAAHPQEAPVDVPTSLEASGPEPATADREKLAEIVRADRIATTRGSPGVSRYLQDVLLGVISWLSFRLDRLAPGVLVFLRSISQGAAWVLFIVALAILAIFVARLLRDRLRRRALESDEPDVMPVAEADAARATGRTRQDWADDLRRHLTSGEVAAACEALWWWLARSIVSGPVERSWTSRELLSRAGRRDLAAPVRRLDRAIYGAAPPTADEVRRLWGDFEEAIE